MENGKLKNHKMKKQINTKKQEKQTQGTNKQAKEHDKKPDLSLTHPPILHPP